MSVSGGIKMVLVVIKLILPIALALLPGISNEDRIPLLIIVVVDPIPIDKGNVIHNVLVFKVNYSRVMIRDTSSDARVERYFTPSSMK